MKGLKYPVVHAAGFVLMVSAFPVMANEPLSELAEEEMSAYVAQDGITLRLRLGDFDGAGPGTDVGFSVGRSIFHDSDGTPGAIVKGSSIAGDRIEFTMASGSEIVAVVDSVGDAKVEPGNQPMLNLNISVPAFTLKTAKTYAARSNGVSAAVTDLSGAITEGMTINVGALTLNAQLGSEAQGSMVLVTASMAGGITASGFVLNDVNSGGAIRIDTIAMDNTGAGTALDVSVGLDIGVTGLVARVNQLGTLAGGMDVRLGNVRLGNAGATPIGNVDIVGLNLASTLVEIAGHL